jgi:hypothetical protein
LTPAIVEGDAFLIVNSLGISVPTGLDLHKEEDYSILSAFLSRFLEACRFLFKHYEMPRSFVGISPLGEANLPTIGQVIQADSPMFLNEYRWRTAVEWKRLNEVNQIVLSGGVSAFHGILLDAFEAFRSQDYRRSILYSAVAVETMAAEVLDQEYERLLTGDVAVEWWRVIELPTSSGTVRKDPVYDYLASRDDFRSLLHERPLYLMRRSLLVDNQEVFRRALALYKTRNKLVHRGAVPPEGSDDHLQLNLYGAEQALECALAIFSWFGADSDYVRPYKRGFVEGFTGRFGSDESASPNPGLQADGFAAA